MKTAITWLGHASIKVERDKIFYFDPWIENNPKCPIKLNDITKADVVCVTHGHNDHIGDSLQIIKNTKAVLICSPEIGFYANDHGIKYDEDSIPLNVGGTWESDSFSLTMVDATHTSELMAEDYVEKGTLTPGSGAVGYVLTFKGGPSIYFAGDTGVFGDMSIIRELYKPDIAILPVGGKYNMGVPEVGYAAQLLQASIILPIHYDTFPNQKLNIEFLIETVRVRSPFSTVIRWIPGEVYEYEM